MTPQAADKDAPALLSLSGTNLPPRAKATCLFGAVAIAAATIVDGGQLYCKAPPLQFRTTVGLSIDVAGLGRSSDVSYTFYDADGFTRVERLEPAYGPPSGRTTVMVRGVSLAELSRAELLLSRAEPSRARS